jgi:hypothetical protein
MKRLLLLSIIFFSISLSTTRAQSALTIGEIFDFNIGDEFHHLVNDGMPIFYGMSKERYTIVDKYFSQNNDTVFYVRHQFGYTHLYSPSSYGFQNYNDTVFYTNFNSIVGVLNTPWPFAFPDTTQTGYPYNFDQNTDLFDTQWMVNSYYANFWFAMDFCIGKLGVGIGTVIQGYGPEDNTGGAGGGFGYDMTYYKKGDLSVGTPDTLDSTDIGVHELYPPTSTQITLYPNPTSEFINFEWKKNSYFDIRIFSFDGRVVVDRKRIYRGQQINIAELSNGHYIMELVGANGTTHSPFMKL